MEQEVVDFIANGIMKGAQPEQLIQGVMQNFNLSEEDAAEYISVVAEELEKSQGGQKDQEGQTDSQQGDGSAEKVLNILQQVQMPPEAAVALIKAILDLNEAGLKELLKVLDQALGQGNQQQAQQVPEGMSANPMENI